MNIDLVLSCHGCGGAALADDEFCESCGAELGERRDASRHHVELDAGVAAAVSDRGLVHRRNEDAMFAASNRHGAVAVVCDGVSASAAPQVAAQVAAGVIGRTLTTALEESAVACDALADALAAADAAVLDVPWMPSGDRSAPSCTAVAALWDGTTVTIGWAGDSRAYWVDDGGAHALTVDHSWAEAQVDAGVLDRSAAEIDPRAHAITRWLGADAPHDAPAVVDFHPSVPGTLVLCSDGLWNHVPTSQELAELVVGQSGPPCDLARALVETALQRGGHDNVTVAVIDVSPQMVLRPGGGRRR